MVDTKLGPKCPNHNVTLEEAHNGRGICPISGAVFSYSGDEAEKTRKLKINSLGQIEETFDWNVQHVEGDDI